MNRNQPFLSRFYTHHRIISNLIIILLTALLLLWCAMIFLNVWTHHGSTSTVPQVHNMSYATAAQLLRECDLDIEIADSVYDRSVAPGTVIESWPKAGAVVKRHRQVYVTITAFSPKMVRLTMPVTGVSSRQAISYLRASASRAYASCPCRRSIPTSWSRPRSTATCCTPTARYPLRPLSPLR